MFGIKKKPLKPCPVWHKYKFAKAFFHDVRPGVSISKIAGMEQLRRYMSGTWWNSNPVTTAHNILVNWGAK